MQMLRRVFGRGTLLRQQFSTLVLGEGWGRDKHCLKMFWPQYMLLFNIKKQFKLCKLNLLSLLTSCVIRTGENGTKCMCSYSHEAVTRYKDFMFLPGGDKNAVVRHIIV